MKALKFTGQVVKHIGGSILFVAFLYLAAYTIFFFAAASFCSMLVFMHDPFYNGVSYAQCFAR